MLITLIGILIRIPTGYYFGIVLGWGLIGAWTGMFGDMIWRALSSTIRYVGGRWVRTRV
jgi:Na+-driven multidrug efflux pump